MVRTTDMANSATPITAEFASSVKFGNKVTTKTIEAKAKQARTAGNTQFDHSLTLGSMMVQVKEWWSDGGKEEVLDAGFDADFKGQIKPLTGLSASQFYKVIQAFTNSVEKPEVLTEYQAAEEEAGQACNVERWNKFAKEGKLDEDKGEPKGKNLAQFQVTGVTPAVRINAGGHLDTNADEDDVVCGLAVLKRALIAGGMEAAAECIVLPEELENGETAEEVAESFYANIG